MRAASEFSSAMPADRAVPMPHWHAGGAGTVEIAVTADVRARLLDAAWHEVTILIDDSNYGSHRLSVPADPRHAVVVLESGYDRLSYRQACRIAAFIRTGASDYAFVAR